MRYRQNFLPHHFWSTVDWNTDVEPVGIEGHLSMW
jgi:hypothetical protein